MCTVSLPPPPSLQLVIYFNLLLQKSLEGEISLIVLTSEPPHTVSESRTTAINDRKRNILHKQGTAAVLRGLMIHQKDLSSTSKTVTKGFSRE